MKLISKIKDLIEDDKNPRVWERFWIVLYLLTLEFVLVGAVVGVAFGAVVGGAGAVVVGAGAVVAVAFGVAFGAVVVGAVAVAFGVAFGAVVANPSILVYLIIGEIIITIIAEYICYLDYKKNYT